MKKKIFVLTVMVLMFLAVFAEKTVTVQPKTKKYPIESRPSAVIILTEIYASEYWAEFYLTYEENKDSYDEPEAEKIIYEFISEYKRNNSFSTVEIEDLKGAAIGKMKTALQKRIIFRQIRK